MVNKVYKFLSLTDLVCVIGVFEFQNRKVYKSLLASKSSDEIVVIHCKSFDSLSDLLEKGVPKDNYSVLIHMEGDAVINRVVEKNSQYRNSVIYEGKEEDFFFSEYHEESKVFLSLTRKTEIEILVKRLKELGKIISGISVGPFVIYSLTRLLPEQGSFITPSGKVLLKNTHSTFEPGLFNDDFLLEFDGGKYGIYDIVLIGAFVDYCFPGDLLHSTFPDVDSSGQEMRFKRKIRLLISLMLPICLILIIFGHLHLSSQTKKLAENESSQINMQQTMDQLTRLKEEREVKRKIFQSSGVFISDYLTGYIVEICNSLPEEINLTRLGVFPGPERLKENSKVEFDFKSIRIEGLTSSQHDINTWIQDLQDFPWVTKIEILSFDRESVDKFKFQFKILM